MRCKTLITVLFFVTLGSPLWAFTIAEITIVTGIVTSIPVNGYLAARKKAEQTVCTNNLKQIYKALLMYEISNGALPKASFYPKDGAKNKKSIVKRLRLPKALFTCKCLPALLREKGLTYLWNDNVNGLPFHNIKDRKKTWLLVEMSIVSPEIPGPHGDRYNVLWAVGSTSLVDALPYIKTVKKETKKEAE